LTAPLGSTVTYSLTNDAGARFAIDAGTGIVTTADYLLLDGPATHTITVAVTDGTDIATADFDISFTNVAPTFGALADETLLPSVAGLLSHIDIAITDPGPDTWTATVNYGDGASDESTVETNRTFDLNHTYTVEGEFTVTVTLDDGDGGSHSDSFVVTVQLNTPPVANAGGPYIVAEGSTIALDGSGSSDPENNIVSWDWDLDADGLYDDATGQIPSLSWPDNGAYTAGLKVTDLYGESSTDTATVTVANVAPTPSIVSISDPKVEGTTITVTGSATDPAGANDTLSYAWTVNKDSLAFDSGTGTSFSFTPDDNASYQIVLTVSDEDGGSTTVDNTIDVANVAPTPSIVSISDPKVEGTAITVTGSATDPAGANDTLSYAWTINKDSLAFDSGTGTNFSFTPDDNASYQIVLTVSDEDGGSTTVDNTIDVANVAPVVTAGADQFVNEGDPMTFSGSFTDPGLLDTHTFDWDFGDGNTASGSLTPTHVYAVNDTYIVTLTVTDNDGDSGTDTLEVYVNNLTDLSGRVYEDVNENGLDDAEPGIGGVTLRLTGSDDLGQVDRTAVTAPDGSYMFTNLRPGTYDLVEVDQPFGMLDGLETAGAALPELQVIVGNDIFVIVINVDDPDAPDFAFGEILAVNLGDVVYGGDGTGFALLGLTDTEIKIHKEATVDGNVGVGPSTDSGDELADFKDDAFIDGNVFMDPTSDFKHVDLDDISGSVFSQDLSQAIQDALDAAARAASLTATQVFGTLGGNEAGDSQAVLTIIGNGGVNVIEIAEIDLTGDQTLVLSGGASDLFILNVSGDFHLNDRGSIILEGDIDEGQVLWNLVAGDTGNKDYDNKRVHIHKDTVVFGTILATASSVKLDGHVIGALIAGGKDIHIHGHHGDLSQGSGGEFIDFGQAGKPQVLTMSYTADGDSATSHSQKQDKVNITGAPSTAPTVYIIASDKAGSSDGNASIFFSGEVNDGETFNIDATLAGLTKLKSKTFVHIFDTEGGVLLQTVEFHTSGSQPIALDNDFGPVELIAYIGEAVDDDDHDHHHHDHNHGDDNDHDHGLFSVNYTPFALAKDSDAVDPVANPGLSGFVYEDSNGDGIKNPAESGIEGVTLTLLDSMGAEVAVTVTNAEGWYEFTGLGNDTYTIVQTQPLTLTDGVAALDGDEAAGSLGGTVDNTQDSNIIADIVYAAGVIGSGYNFGEVAAAGLSGFVFEDFNNDGIINFGEKAIEGVVLNLSGVDDRGNMVTGLVSVTDSEGIYAFTNLRPGTYIITEDQPVGYEDGIDIVGSLGGQNSANNTISQIQLAGRFFGTDYNFAERPAASDAVSAGQTAAIGFWKGSDGKKLIEQLNGDKHSTLLGDWLAATFSNMYGDDAGDNNLAGLSNKDIHKFFKKLVKDRKKGIMKKLSHDAQWLDAQVMAVAFATYVTNETLISQKSDPLDTVTPTELITHVNAFGFQTTAHGVSVATFNVGDSGDAFGVVDYSTMTVLDLLFAVNERTTRGVLYDLNGNGKLDVDPLEEMLREWANTVFAAINMAGGIS
ncbi:MAG: PKD domain-containing protein, partial [bacterium]|nr:PKD domain-containing protein [bacterium]